jgi:hypothetical protein
MKIQEFEFYFSNVAELEFTTTNRPRPGQNCFLSRKNSASFSPSET